MKMFDRIIAIACIVLAALLLNHDAKAQSYWDGSADYCSTVNPCKAWSYGWQERDGAFNLMTISRDATHCGIPGVICWLRDRSVVTLPQVGVNSTPSAIEFVWNDEFIVVPTSTVHMQPGVDGSNAVLQFHVQKSGRHVIQGNAQLMHNWGGLANLIVYINDTRVITKLLSGYGDIRHFKLDQGFVVGDTVRFAIDPEGTHERDHTELRVGVMHMR